MPVSGYNAPVVNYLQNYSAPVVSGTPGFNMPQTAPVTPVTGGTTAGYPVQQTNIADIPNMETLTKVINDLNLAAQNQANMGRIPGEQGLEQQSSNLIGQELAGQVPSDVINLLRQQGAEQNVRSGRDSNAAYLNALGRTSLQQQQAGQQNLSQAAARNPVAPIYDPSKLLITPYQQSQLNLEQAQLQLEANRQAMARGAGGGGGGYGPYSGTGGTAMGPTYTGPRGLPPDTSSGGGGGMDAETQYWLDQLNQPENTGIDAETQYWLDQLNSGPEVDYGGEMTAGTPDYSTLDQLYAGMLGG